MSPWIITAYEHKADGSVNLLYPLHVILAQNKPAAEAAAVARALEMEPDTDPTEIVPAVWPAQ